MLAAKEIAAVVGVIDPDAYAAGSYSTGWIKADKFARYLAAVLVGDMVATSTVDAKLEQASSGSGTGVKDISGRAITQLTQAGTDDNKQAMIDLIPANHMDIAGGFFWFRLTMTVATAASDAGGLVLGVTPVDGPAFNSDASTVDEVV